METTTSNCCPNCGAPVLSEICKYCGTRIDNVDSNTLSAEFKMIKCKLAKFTTIYTLLPLIFALSFLIVPLIIIVIALSGDFGNDTLLVYLISIPLFCVGVGFSVFVIRNIIMIMSNRLKGEVVRGTVYGYVDDNIMINDRKGQQVKVLVYHDNSYKFLLIPLADTTKPYVVNSNLNIKLYKNTAIILVGEN